MTSAGATPKEVMSDSESYCSPKADCVGQARHPAVHAVEHHGHEDGDGRGLEAVVHGLHDGVEPANRAAVVKALGSR